MDCLVKMESLNFIVLFATVISCLIAFWYLFFVKNYWCSRKIPSVEGVLPIIGNMWSLITMRESFGPMYQRFYNAHQDESMVGFHNFQSPSLLIRDPELIKIVMLGGFTSFSNNAFWLDPSSDSLLCRNPFFNHGSDWKSQRTTLISGLSNKRLKLITHQIGYVSEKFANFLNAETKNNGVIVVGAHDFFSRFTAEVIALCAFGIDGRSFTNDPHSFYQTVKKMLVPSFSQHIAEMITFYYPIVRKVFGYQFLPSTIDQYFRQIVRDVIESRKHSPVPENDFLEHIIDSQNSKTDEFDEDYVVGHAASFFLDGHITTSIAIGFTAYEIAVHSDIQVKLREEIVEVLGNYEGQMTNEAIHDLKYLEQVINETMRIFPPLGMLGKVCTKEYNLVGEDGLEFQIQPGTEVIISLLGLHNDPKHWNNPSIFNPERFNEENKNTRHKYAYLPFGAGPRACVGTRIAMLQMKASLATLLLNYSLELDSRTKEPVEVNPLSSIFTSPPDDEIWIRIVPLKI